MLTAELVLEVSRTGQPATVAGYELTVDYLMRKTRDKDWNNVYMGRDWPGAYLVLKTAAATAIAKQLNASQPWKQLPAAKELPAKPRRRRVRAVAGTPKALPSAEVVDAEVVA